MITPINVISTNILGGVRITWEDSSTDVRGYEVWASIDSGVYTLLGTSVAKTYDHTVSGYTEIKYKIQRY